MPVSDSPSMKKAAALLLKGGTLSSEQCPECKGITVRFQGKSTCAACGREVEESTGALKAAEALSKNETHDTTSLQSMSALASLVTDKLLHVAGELKNDRDVGSQQKKADLVETYLRILQLLKS